MLPRNLKRHPLAFFLALVFVVEWIAVLALVPLSPLAVGVIALVPAPVALLVTAIQDGKKGPGLLMRRCLAWRAGLQWYALAIFVPVTVSLFVAAEALLASATLNPQPEVILAYLPLTLVLAAGEEIGWQGYAFPRIRTAYPPLLSAVIFGIIHAAFHLPMYLLPLPAELRQASPFPLFLVMTTAFALYRVWFFDQTAGNVPLIIVFHAAINTSVLLLAGVEPLLLGWLLPLTWILAALPLLFWRGFREGLAVRTIPDSSSLPQD